MPESPEMLLLENLAGEDLPLHAVLAEQDFRDLAHAKQAVAAQILTGHVLLLDGRDAAERPVTPAQARWLLEDPAVWDPGSSYRLRLTDAGAAYYWDGVGR